MGVSKKFFVATMFLLVATVTELEGLEILQGESAINNTTMLRLGDDDEDTCPFIYDKYEIQYSWFGQKLTWSFSPADYGLSHGYYCSFGIEHSVVDFKGCECPFARYCEQEWGTVKADPLTIHIGRCTFYNYALAVPFAVTFLLAALFVTCCCRRREKREIIIVRADPNSGYVRLN